MLRLATVGTSAIVRRALEAVADLPGIDHVAAYSRDPARARALLERDDALVVSDLRALAASPAVDAVYIASPNALHAEQAATLLEAGKHVLVEKPATSTAVEFARLREIAKDNGVVFLEAVRNAGFDPGVARIAEVLPEVGQVRLVRFEYGQRSSRYDDFLAGETVNIFNPAMSAGALMDIGVYCAQLAVELFGVPGEIHAAYMCPLRGGIDGAGVVVLSYREAAVTLAYSKVSDSRVASEIQGEEGTLVIDHVPDPRHLVLVDRHGRQQDIRVDKAGINMVYEFAEFLRLVETSSGADRWNDVTERRLQLMDSVRAGMGLRFPADRPVD